MTAAATDGSSSLEASWVDRPAAPREQRPGDRREHAGEDVDGDEDLPDPHAGEPAPLRVVADGADHAPETGAGESDDHADADHAEHDDAPRDNLEHTVPESMVRISGPRSASPGGRSAPTTRTD